MEVIKMSVAYYVAILLFCYGCLGLILMKTYKGSLFRQKKVYITILIFASAFFITADLVWMCINGNMKVSPALNFTLNLLYFLGTMFVSYTFFFYSESIQESKLIKNKKFLFVASIPAIVLLFLMFTSMETKLIFYIDANNEYRRGILYPLQIIFSFGYPLVSSIKAMFKAIKKEFYFKRSDFLSLFKFLIFPAAGLTLQYFIPHVPFCSIGVTLGILWLFLENEDMIIYVDPLTDIYNKKALTKRLHHDLETLDANSRYYLFMLDIDKFKSINDTYGHVEGDLALMILAKVLKAYCNANHAFVARYGGDEFSILLNCRPHQTIFSFCMGLEEAVKQANVEYRRPYEIKVSYGYAMYEDTINNIPDFIEKADEQLYINKQHRRKLEE